MSASESSFLAEIGRYQVIRTLGQGAMGRVYLAHDRVLDRDVAIKILRADLNISEEQRGALLERMRQEARASARLRHPNIVGLYDMGEHPEAGLFLVFEYVEGPSLKDSIGCGGIGPAEAARMARDVGSALTTAHEAGVLHRDIKPENIIVSKGGAKVADFGIARVPNSTLTRDGGLLGTPAYSAPEAIASGTFSPYTDQFSFAATLYEAVSLRRAFPGEDAVTVATKISNQEPPLIAALCGLDPSVDAILSRALSKNPKSRFGSCEEFGHALADCLEAHTSSELRGAHGAALGDPAQFRPGTRTLRVALGGTAFGVLLSVAVGLLLSEASSRGERSPEASRGSRRERTAVVGWLAGPLTVVPIGSAAPTPSARAARASGAASAAVASQAVTGLEGDAGASVAVSEAVTNSADAATPPPVQAADSGALP